MVYGQGLATEAAEAWRKAAAPGLAWLRHRNAERGLMTLVFRCWRERVEHDAAGINNDSSRWRVRKQTARQQRAGPRTRAHGGQRRASPSTISDEKRFADGQIRNFTRLAETYKWSPWQDGGTRTAEEVDDDGGDPAQQHAVDEAQVQRWRLKCDLKRVATFYRVTGAQVKAEARKRSARTRARFRAWADSVRRVRATEGRGAETAGGGGARRWSSYAQAGGRAWGLL